MVIKEFKGGRIRIHDELIYEKDEDNKKALDNAAQVMKDNELRRSRTA